MNLQPKENQLEHFNLSAAQKQRIILTGFMGAGKTTIGKLLATAINYQFVDTDAELEDQSGLTVEQYIHRFGEEAFRRQETRILNLALQEDKVVIATGGGVVLSRFNRKRMLYSGLVCWLKAPFTLLKKRIGSFEGRPLLQQDKDDQAIRQRLIKRLPFYENCHYVVDTTFKNVEQVLEELTTLVYDLQASENKTDAED